jgi:hypothetical protein
MFDWQRPPSRVVAFVADSGLSAQRVTGWRSASINRWLDAWAFVVDVDQALVPKATRWQRANPERVNRERVRAAAKHWRESIMRPQWVAYCAAYRAAWPSDGAPVGFGRFLASRLYVQWSSDPVGCLAVPNTRTLQSARQALYASGNASFAGAGGAGLAPRSAEDGVPGRAINKTPAERMSA